MAGNYTVVKGKKTLSTTVLIYSVVNINWRLKVTTLTAD